jgi:hypothetical protein
MASIGARSDEVVGREIQISASRQLHVRTAELFFAETKHRSEALQSVLDAPNRGGRRGSRTAAVKREHRAGSGSSLPWQPMTHCDKQSGSQHLPPPPHQRTVQHACACTRRTLVIEPIQRVMRFYFGPRRVESSSLQFLREKCIICQSVRHEIPGQGTSLAKDSVDFRRIPLLRSSNSPSRQQISKSEHTSRYTATCSGPRIMSNTGS